MIGLMNPERKRGRRWILRAGTVGIGVAVVGPPLWHINNTLRILGTAFGNDIDCTNGKEAKEKGYPFDAIVVPGAGSVWTDEGFIPNDYGRIRLEAAALAFARKLAPRIILLDGANSLPEDNQTNREYLKQTFGDTFGQELPEEAIIGENHSINTATNMRELKKIAKEHNLLKVIIVTNDFHKTRATLFACQFDIAASSISAEELIIDAYPERKQEVHRLYHTREVGEIENKELLKIIWSLWDPNGRVPTWLTKLQR